MLDKGQEIDLEREVVQRVRHQKTGLGNLLSHFIFNESPQEKNKETSPPDVLVNSDLYVRNLTNTQQALEWLTLTMNNFVFRPSSTDKNCSTLSLSLGNNGFKHHRISNAFLAEIAHTVTDQAAFTKLLTDAVDVCIHLISKHNDAQKLNNFEAIVTEKARALNAPSFS